MVPLGSCGQIVVEPLHREPLLAALGVAGQRAVGEAEPARLIDHVDDPGRVEPPQSGGADCYVSAGALVSEGYNLISNITGCTFSPSAGDLITTNAGLSLLVGEPAYHPLQSTSAAIDAGNPSGCIGYAGLLLLDQRGAVRTGRCDSGAVEYTPAGPAASLMIVEGSGQRTFPGSAFAMPLRVAVLDSAGNPDVKQAWLR